jgi:hypothetical protein
MKVWSLPARRCSPVRGQPNKRAFLKSGHRCESEGPHEFAVGRRSALSGSRCCIASQSPVRHAAMESIDFRPCLSPVCSWSINAIGQPVNSQTPQLCMRSDQTNATLCVKPEQSTPRRMAREKAQELRKHAFNESPRIKFSLAHCSSLQLREPTTQ